jgi:hypothetical protein
MREGYRQPLPMAFLGIANDKNRRLTKEGMRTKNEHPNMRGSPARLSQQIS